MAGEEAAESSRRRRRTLMMPNSTGAAPETPRTGEPKESLALAVAGEPEKDDSCGCNSNFECNICLDVAKEPVVTPCGHLFCWPCLYRWLYAQSPFCECPVCKGVVLKENITPIYGRGSEEGESTANPDLPPRPQANRRESLRQQLQTAGIAGDTSEIELVIMQLIQNQHIVRGLPTPAGTEMTSVPAARQRTTPAVVAEPGSSRQSRPSESPTIRRTRRPQ
uniref:E3 ubiquitin-protein ligase RMA n=1 Tax=Saccharum hybrid cultivar R570 TaxID=131158 RepID=A0A059Q2J2_9POAL|nr:zinc finger, C3HC4 type family protein [Saccharum hybrid cultivar R570]